MPKPIKDNELRNYLLGNVLSEAEKERIEQTLMFDAACYERLELAEEELIQEYAGDELTGGEREAFERYFLVSEENIKRVKFALALSAHIKKQKELAKTEERVEKKSFLTSLRAFISSPFPIAAGLLFVCFGFSLWYFYWRASETSEAMASLNRAYQTARPLESRITDFEYAPFGSVRGAQNSGINLTERNRAERILLDEVTKQPTAENLHALGRLYLAEQKFDDAVEQLQKAQKIAQTDAEVFNDLGVALLEKNRSFGEREKEKNPQIRFLALENFEKAVELNPNLVAARFNRAVCLETLNLPAQAKEAWRKYLELDADSGWAEEARRHLKSLESNTLPDLSGDESEARFLFAFRKKDDDEAFRIAGLNRELIKEKYLPQKIAFSITDGNSEERTEKLEALRYLGELEKKRIGDFFAADLAQIYSSLPEDKLNVTKEAQAAVRRGYQLCLKTDGFSQALEEFTRAEQLFRQADNPLEAETVSRYFIAYCLYNLDRRSEAHRILEEINDFAERKKYKWFALMNFYWLLGGRESLGLKTLTEINNDYETALRQSQTMADNYMTQKFLLALVGKSHFVNQENKTFAYLQKILDFSSQPDLSVRQKFRSFDKIVEITASKNYSGLSKAVVLESVALAEAMTDPAFIIGSEINAGIVHTRTGNFDEAEKWFERAKKNAENLPEEAQRDENLARVFLYSGHLEKSRKNYRKAVEYYDSSLELAGKSRAPLQIYEIKKSRLLAYQSLGGDAEVEKDIASTLQIAEEYRKKILDEQERHSFFDNQQTVFDIAVEHAARNGRLEQAYDYAEAANSRSLLDWIQKGASVTTLNNKSQILFDDSSAPLTIGEIREQMPPEVEILQFTVLENKVLIWIISKEKFALEVSQIDSAELKTKIDDYLKSIKTKKSDGANDVSDASRELYRALVEPALPHLSANKEIVLIPDKFLFHLPFASLISSEGQFLLEQFVISYAPSANVFIACTKNARHKTSNVNERVLSIGNPAFDPYALTGLANLPDSGVEAREIAKNYSESKVFCDGEASKNAFLSDYRNYEVIHFAGHYLSQPDAPMLSKLVMAKNSETESDNFITNVELLKEKLPQARLVVLSACQTGVEGYYNGEGLIGLSRTFLAADVPLVVASQWNVDSAGTSELMKKFHYYRRKENISTSRSLRQSQIDMLKGADRRFQSPYFWAGFAVFGGYASF